MDKSLYSFIITIATFALHAQPTPFSCSETEGFGYYIASATTNTSDNNLTFSNSRLSKIVTSTAVRTTICADLGTSLNALGFNPRDNFLYAFSRYDAVDFSGKLYRIGANCQKLEIPVTGGVISFNTNNTINIDNAGGNLGSGTFDGQNNFYVNTTYTNTSTTGFTNKLQVINITGNTANVSSSVTLTCPSCTGTNKLHIADIIYDEVSGQIYGSNRQTNKLYTINTTTGVLTEVGTTGITSFILGMYKNKDGLVRALDQNGRIYDVNLSTGSFSLLSTVSSLRSSNADAASGCYESILPVELISFSGKRKNDQVQLRWETASEQNSDYFDVQRSLDGIKFLDIDRIPAAGTSAKLRTYYSEDHSSLQVEYYRLKQVDLDGSIYLSEIIRIPVSVISSFTLYPTVVNEVVKYTNREKEELRYAIYNLQGSRLMAGKTSSHEGEIDVTDLYPGVYFIELRDSFGTIVAKEKFLKI